MGEFDKRSFDQAINRAVFLDRDGVINRAISRGGRAYAPATIEELEFLPKVAEAIEGLREAGFRLIVVTNQPDVASGKQQREVVEAMHHRIRLEFSIDDIKVCYHSDQDNCRCRKPKPGMLVEAATQWSLNLRQSFMVGDTWRDIGAGQAAGCKTILIQYEYDERRPDPPDAVAYSLLEASELILSGKV